jgi:large subunit ribosomal protein L28
MSSVKVFGTIIKSNRENRRLYYKIFRGVDGYLLDGKQVLSGNNKPKSLHKTKRKWFPNVHQKQLYSELFDKSFLLTVSTSALRSIDKKGGLDNYLLHTSDSNLASEWGSKMKFLLKEKMASKNENTTPSEPSSNQTTQQ